MLQIAIVYEIGRVAIRTGVEFNLGIQDILDQLLSDMITTSLMKRHHLIKTVDFQQHGQRILCIVRLHLLYIVIVTTRLYQSIVVIDLLKGNLLEAEQADQRFSAETLPIGRLTGSHGDLDIGLDLCWLIHLLLEAEINQRQSIVIFIITYLEECSCRFLFCRDRQVSCERIRSCGTFKVAHAVDRQF